MLINFLACRKKYKNQSRHVSFFKRTDVKKCKYQIWMMSIISFGNPDVTLLLGLKRHILDESSIF